MGFFSSKIVDRHTAEWQFEHFEILIKNLSSGPGLPDAELQLPTRESFIDTENPGKIYQGHDLAKFIFNRIKQQCGVPEVEIPLIPTEESKPQNIGNVILQTEDTNAAAGRYIVEQNEAGKYEESISYDKDLTQNPAQLVATLAHELSHLLHNRMDDFPEFDPPILYEMFTDLTAVYLGYGVFMANGRFSYESNGEMWKSSSTGYLSEQDLIFATAIFMRIKNIQCERTKPYLKKHIYKMLQQGLKQLDKYDENIGYLRELEPELAKTG